MPISSIGRYLKLALDRFRGNVDSSNSKNTRNNKKRYPHHIKRSKYYSQLRGTRDNYTDRNKEYSDHLENERSLHNSTRAIAWLTGVLAFVGVVSAIFSGLQWTAISGQLGAMEADRRPWVSAKPALDGIFWNKNGANIRYHLELTNSGHETGLNMMVAADIIPFTADIHPISWVRKKSEDFKKRGRITGFGVPIFPNVVNNIIREKLIDRSEINAFNNRVGAHPEIGPYLMPIDLAFVINYFSPNGAPHQTYCWAVISKINSGDPFSVIDDTIKVDVDLRGDALRLRNFGINCGAD
jgi:hypothetical protein